MLWRLMLVFACWAVTCAGGEYWGDINNNEKVMRVVSLTRPQTNLRLSVYTTGRMYNYMYCIYVLCLYLR